MYHIAGLVCNLSLEQTVQYLTFLNRIALKWAKLYHKPPKSHTIYGIWQSKSSNKRLLFLTALYNKRLILSYNFYRPLSNKFHLTEEEAFIKNIPVAVTFGVKYIKFSTCKKISLSKARTSMSRN